MAERRAAERPGRPAVGDPVGEIGLSPGDRLARERTGPQTRMLRIEPSGQRVQIDTGEVAHWPHPSDKLRRVGVCSGGARFGQWSRPGAARSSAGHPVSHPRRPSGLARPGRHPDPTALLDEPGRPLRVVTKTRFCFLREVHDFSSLVVDSVGAGGTTDKNPERFFVPAKPKAPSALPRYRPGVDQIRRAVDDIALPYRLFRRGQGRRPVRPSLGAAYGLAHRAHGIANSLDTQFAVASGVRGSPHSP